MRTALLVVLLAMMPGFAWGQAPSGGNVPPSIPNIISNPNNFPHPVQSWNGLTRPEVKGATVAYITVPPQPVTVVQAEPGTDGEPVRWREHVVTVPGYVVTRTTLGYDYPERWAQTSAGFYQWRLLPAEFRRR